MRTSSRFLLTLFAGLLVLASPARAQLATQLGAQLQLDLAAFKAQRNVHGLSAAVLFPDQSLWTGSAGVASPTDSLLPATLLGIGSITKTFTAALVLRLAAGGQVQLDDSIARYVPLVRQYPNINPGVTVRQLLAHTSGVYNYTNSPQFAAQVNTVPDTHLFTPADILGWVLPMRFAPGARFEYSNTGYALLGMLLENVLGKPITQIYRDELLTPLQLTSTFRGYNDSIPANLAVSNGWIQSRVNGPFDFNLSTGSRNSLFSIAFGNGEMISTATDLVHWAKALYGTTTVLDSASLALMLTVNPRSTTAGLPYGLGAMRTMRSQKVMWGHNGSIPGYIATFGYVASCGVAIAVMVNESNPVTEAAVNRLFSIINRSVCTVQGIADAVEPLRPALYPNPAQGTTTLTYSCPVGTKQAHLTIHDALGRRVRTLPLHATTTQAVLDLAGLPAGLYACRVLTDGRSSPTTPLVVQP